MTTLWDLKREAIMLKDETNGEFDMEECLEIVARKHGFRNWAHASRTLKVRR